MSFGKKLKKIARVYWNGMTRRQWKNVRRKVGLTSKNKLVRGLRRSFRGGFGSSVAYSQPVSAYTVDTYAPRTLSQLTGGR